MKKFLGRFRPSQAFEIEKSVAQKKIVRRIFDALEGETEDIGKKLLDLNVRLNPVAVSEVIKKLPTDSAWTFFNWARGHNGFKHDKHTYTAIIKRFTKAKDSKHLKQIAQDMNTDGCGGNLVTFTSLIRAHAKAGEINEALEVWSFLKDAGLQPDVNAYNRLLRTLLSARKHREALRYYKEMLQSHCSPNGGTYHCLIESLVDTGKLEAAYLIIKKMPRLGVRPFQLTYETLIKANLEANNLDAVINLLVLMKETNRDPSLDIMRSVRRACRKVNKNTEILVQHWGPYFAYNTESSGGDSSTSGRSDEGTTTGSEFEDTDEDLEVDKGTLASLLTPWNPETAQRLQKMDFQWTTEIVSYLMKDLEDVDVAFGFFEWLRSQENFKHDLKTYVKMITILLSARRFQLVDCLLDEMHEQGLRVPAWVFNRIVECYSSCHDPHGALKLFAKMDQMGTPPDSAVYTGVIDVLMREGMYQRAMEIYAQMLQAGYEPNNFTYSVLINGLGHAGKAEAGHKLLNIMRKHGYKPNVITYTAVIGGYEKLGRIADVIGIYKEMQSAGIEPTPITYRVLSQAFYRVGRWNEGKKMEEKMEELISTDVGAVVMEESRQSACKDILETLEDLAVLE